MKIAVLRKGRANLTLIKADAHAHVSSTKMIEELTDSQKALAEYMSELSEKAYFAGWMEGAGICLVEGCCGEAFRIWFVTINRAAYC